MARKAPHPQTVMAPVEKRAARSLATIYAMRMLGLFMILPVFVLYAEDLQQVTPTLIGVAIGIYGLTQALLQIPYGMISDRIGRKPVIIVGLVVFAAGSIIAAEAHSIWGVILGRAVQGAGAIAAVLMALTADLVREDHRLKAMAIIGMTIGMAFAVSMIAGPVLNNWIGVPGIFWLTAAMAVFGVLLTLVWVPNPETSRFHRDTEPVPAQFLSVLKNGQLLRLDLGILVLHMILTASFVVLPLALRDEAGMAAADHWHIYLPVMVLAIGAMVPFVILAENRRKMKQVFLGAILVLSACQLSLYWLYHWALGITLILFIFFTAFNILEASLPSLVAKLSPPDRKGTAMGVYSSSQFFGAFLGGYLGGRVHEEFGMMAVFVFCAACGLLWFLAAVTMQEPRYLSSFSIRIGRVDPGREQELVMRLTQVTGVAEAVVVADDEVAYLKVDLHALDRDALNTFAVNIPNTN